MSSAGAATAGRVAEEVEFATFYIGELLMGVDIRRIQGIIRRQDLSPVPEAPECVRGVINLRGDVVTIVDLRITLGLPATDIADSTRYVIVESDDEKIGLLVDRVADVVISSADETDPTPANISGVDARFFNGVCKSDGELLIILNVDEALVVQEDVAGG